MKYALPLLALCQMASAESVPNLPPPGVMLEMADYYGSEILSERANFTQQWHFPENHYAEDDSLISNSTFYAVSVVANNETETELRQHALLMHASENPMIPTMYMFDTFLNYTSTNFTANFTD